MSINIGFIYPNQETSFRIPLAVSILGACVKNAGHNIKVFDTTFIGSEFKTDIQYSEKKRTVKKSGIEKYAGDFDNRPMDIIVKEFLDDFPVDLIAITMIERNYSISRQIMKSFKKFSDAPVLAGGVFPTIAPEFVIKYPWIDYMCIGEGEQVIAEVANCLSKNEDVSDIQNLWVKKNGTIIKNPLRPLEDIMNVPEQKWDIFDERHFYRPYKGKVYRNGTFEFSRGCMKQCSFCVAPSLKKVQTEVSGARYHRTKDPEYVVNEIEKKVKKYNLTLIHFGDTDFLSGLKYETVEKFAKLYRERINLPFLIQTGAETITDKNIKVLSEAGLDNISVGVESGSDFIRRNIIKKYVSKKRIIEAFKVCRKYRVRATANYMFGVPDETEETMQETLEFNRKCNPPAIAAFFFTPFLGTELYDISRKKGYIKGFNPNQNLHKESPLKMPHLPKERISKFLKEFVEDFNSWKDEY